MCSPELKTLKLDTNENTVQNKNSMPSMRILA